MSISAWILLSLTLIVTVVLLPQVAKSRRMMGQARNDDRFSQGMRVLELEKTPSMAHSVEVAIHQKKAGTAKKSVTRPIRMAQELKAYTDLKSRRVAASSSRAWAARRRAALMSLLAISAMTVAGFAGLGMLAWWVLIAPAVGILLTLTWGSIAARKGRREDLKFLEDIRAVERRLEKSPAGRAALHAGRLRSNSHWAKVAQDSLKAPVSEGTLSEALQRGSAEKNSSSGESIKDQSQDELEQTIQINEKVSTLEETGSSSKKIDQSVQKHLDQIAAKSSKTNRATTSDGTESVVEDATEEGAAGNKWNFSEIPAPSYTLRSDWIRRDVEVAREATGADWEQYAVPMRPQIAQIMPAGEALTSEEVQSAAPVDLETILERRRA